MSGFNIPQILLAAVESYVLTENGKKTLLYAGSVAVSNLLPGNIIASNTKGEKYVTEPIVAGVISSIGGSMFLKEGKYLKNFGMGFVVGSSSAALAETFLYKYYNTADKPLPVPTLQQVRENNKDSGMLFNRLVVA